MPSREALLEAAVVGLAWALIEDDTDVSDRGVSEEHYAERVEDARRMLPDLIANPVDDGARIVVSEFRIVHECGLDVATGDPTEAEDKARVHRCPPQAATPASATDTSE